MSQSANSSPQHPDQEGSPGSTCSPVRNQSLRAHLERTLDSCLGGNHLSPTQRDSLAETSISLADWIRERQGIQTLMVGIAGAQGSGKSTLTRLASKVLTEAYGLRVATLSLDDLYLTRAERALRAATIHPLLITRGVPGTHDTELGIDLLDALRAAHPTSRIELPAFDKAIDDRRPSSACRVFRGCADVVLFEGWCVGAHPQRDADLRRPINALESSEDPDGTWRAYVNARLATDYADLFRRLDRLIMLKVPDMGCVYRWRAEQESTLAAAASLQPHSRIMDSTALRRFIMHYERLTRAMLEEMPHRADRVLYLDQQHRFIQMGVN